ncbi:MAG TPA: methionine synthase, partial [Dehalococcoidia bacterium]|nr:methionine synthase [Dehalococcoidia bacterium]
EQAKDEAVRDVVAKQVMHGLPVLTDGEFRRVGFQDSFGDSVTGYDLGTDAPRQVEDTREVHPLERVAQKLSDPGPAVARRRPVREPLRLVRNVPLEEYRAAAALTDRPVKVALVGPDRISQRFAWERSRDIYATMDDFLRDVVSIERQMVEELVDAGCRYVQMDAPGFTAYVDPPSLEQMRARGEDPDVNLSRSIEAENAVIRGFPGVTFGLHICRGNERSMWHREGHYDAISERLFGGLRHERLLLEYDSDRAGGFEPLRSIRPGTVAVLGLITTKTPQIESVDGLERRILQASSYCALEQLALSPQCGFSSGLAGNLLGEEDQWLKLDVMMRTVDLVWG